MPLSPRSSATRLKRKRRQSTKISRQGGCFAQARARYREAEATAQLRVQEAKRIEFLYARAAAAELEFLRATAEVRKNEETLNALRFEVGRLERDLQMRVNDRQTRLQRLRLYVTQLEGQIAVTRTTSERLEYDREAPHPGARGRAPRRGRHAARSGRGSARELGSARLSLLERSKSWRTSSVGSYRADPGRSAGAAAPRGLPWTQYGAVSATVASVASEVRDGRVRVELAVRPEAASLIPFQHGLPGTVEVEIDRVSPATLVLRTAGQLLAVSGAWRDSQEGRGADGVPGTWRDSQEGRGADRVPGTWRNFQDGRGADRGPGPGATSRTVVGQTDDCAPFQGPHIPRLFRLRHGLWAGSAQPPPRGLRLSVGYGGSARLVRLMWTGPQLTR